MPERFVADNPGTFTEKTLVAGLQRNWLTCVVVVVLVVFAANQFATEWEMFRAAAHPAGMAVDFPGYYVAAKLAGMANAKEHHLYSVMGSSKEATLDRVPPDTEWGQIARENGLGDTLQLGTPPIVAWLLIPLGKLPYQLAFMVWRVLSEILFFLAIWTCLKLCQALNPATLLACTLAGFAFQPFSLTLEKGQFGAALLLTWTLGIFLAEKKQDVASALMFALATILKLTPVFAVGVFVLRRRWKWLAAYVVWTGLLVGIGVWQLGLENHQLYLSRLSELGCGVPGPYNYALAGIMDNCYYRDILSFDQTPDRLPAGLCALNKALALAVFAGVLWALMKRNREGNIVWDLTVVSLVVLLAAPYTWRHYYVLEILPLMFVWFFLKAGRFSHPRIVLWVAAFCTLVAGTRYLDYLQTHFTYGPARVILVALLPLSALLLLGTLLFAYKQQPRERA